MGVGVKNDPKKSDIVYGCPLTSLYTSFENLGMWLFRVGKVNYMVAH